MEKSVKVKKFDKIYFCYILSIYGIIIVLKADKGIYIIA